MTNNPNFVQGIEMPNAKKTTNRAIDLMRPGNGTPWEDRGTDGVVGAYIKTAIKSLTSPALLMDHIRRTETTTDSKGFAVTSAVMWVLGVVAYNIYWLYAVLPSTKYDQQPDMMFYWCTVLLQAALVVLGLFLWLRFGPRLFRSLGATELKNAQPSLIGNIFNYAMGPSILALIPAPTILGIIPASWVVAFIWIAIILMVTAKRRLFMKGSSAVINVIILGFLATVVSVLLIVAISVYGKLGMNGLELKPEPKQLHVTQRD